MQNNYGSVLNSQFTYFKVAMRAIKKVNGLI